MRIKRDYYQLRIELVGHEDKLFRLIHFNYFNNLDYLALTILSIFHTFGNHYYSFADRDNEYLCELGMNDKKFNKGVLPTKDYRISDLHLENDEFYLHYNLTNAYTFRIIIEKICKKYDTSRVPKVLDGKGYGIIEQGKDVLDAFLKGFIDEDHVIFCKNKKYVNVPFDSFSVEQCNKELTKYLFNLRKNYQINYN